MSKWRNPQPEETPISGYNLFQRLNINQNGEIDPTGENIVEKYFNPSTISILYRDFIPLVFRYLFTTVTQDSNRIINAVDPQKDLTETLSAHSGVDSNQDIKMAWNNGDDWFVDRGSRFFHSEDAGDSWTDEVIFGTKLSHSIPAVLNDVPYFVDRDNNKVYKWLNGAFVETAGQPDTSNINLENFTFTENINLRSIFVNEGKLYAVGLGVTDQDGKNSPVLYMSDNEGATWTRTRVFVIEDINLSWLSFDYFEGGQLFNFKPLGNRFFITGTAYQELEFPVDTYINATFSGSLDTVDTSISYAIRVGDDVYNRPSQVRINAFFNDKITVHGYDSSYKPFLKVIEATGETDYSATLLALYDGVDLEWQALYCAFKDDNTLLVSFNVYDTNTTTEIFETHELDLSTSSLTKISDDSVLVKYFQIN